MRRNAGVALPEARSKEAFFSIVGWSSEPKSIHHPAQGLDLARTSSPFEAVLKEGQPEVGERYRFEDKGQSILVVVTRS